MIVRKEQMDNLKKWGKLLGRLISWLSILFIIYAIYRLGFDFSTITNWPLFLAISSLCVIIKCITVFISGRAWALWLRFFADHEIDKKGAVCVYAKANIGKYLPGNVMHYVERNLFAANLNISQKKIALCSVVEVVCLILVAFLISLALSYQQLMKAFSQIVGNNTRQLLFGILLFVILITAVIVILRKKIASYFSDYTLRNVVRTALESLFHYAAVLIALGVIMVVLYAYMGGTVTWKDSALIISGYIIAWVLGFIIPGASGGIGVRELIITLLLGSVMGQELVLTLSVVHRLITICGDFLAYLIEIWIRNKSLGGNVDEGKQ
jgi:uncharacterized membrane protein YbhN (UPF0104 family)